MIRFTKLLFLVAALAMAMESCEPAYAQQHATLTAHPVETFDIVAYDACGHFAWERKTHNMLTTAGANIYLTDTITAGVSSPVWDMGLLYGTSAPTFATADTMASNGWASGTGGGEVTTTQVTNTVRPAITFGSVSGGSVSNSGSVVVYTGNASVTLQGLFVANSSTLDGTTGTLLGEGTFTAAPIAAGYTINVTVTINVNAG
ncbi:MAG: hypothetical protein WBQ86_09700 [Candidatus Binatus sp.]